MHPHVNHQDSVTVIDVYSFVLLVLTGDRLELLLYTDHDSSNLPKLQQSVVSRKYVTILLRWPKLSSLYQSPLVTYYSPLCSHLSVFWIDQVVRILGIQLGRGWRSQGSVDCSSGEDPVPEEPPQLKSSTVHTSQNIHVFIVEVCPEILFIKGVGSHYELVKMTKSRTDDFWEIPLNNRSLGRCSNEGKNKRISYFIQPPFMTTYEWDSHTLGRRSRETVGRVLPDGVVDPVLVMMDLEGVGDSHTVMSTSKHHVLEEYTHRLVNRVSLTLWERTVIREQTIYETRVGIPQELDQVS